jgi:uncharacterized protein (DUF427 family)
MTLTLDHGPLSGDPPDTTNYRLDGPRHKLLLHPFPRRIRAMLGGETVADSRRAGLLHETGILPRLYIPVEDVRMDLLERTDHTTHCPFKGDASYWTVRAGGREAENAAWGYEEPLEPAAWLRGHVSFYTERMDAWYDEDEEVHGHVRDPYHRVDVRASSRRVRVRLGETVLAETERPWVLSETGLPNRLYVPREDVREELLEASGTRTHCPYKGDAAYWSIRVDGRRVDDAAWSYPEPFEDALKVRGALCFLGEGIVTEVDGEPQPGG